MLLAPLLAALAASGAPGQPAVELVWRFPAPPASLEHELGLVRQRLPDSLELELEPVGTSGLRLRVPLAAFEEPAALRAAADAGDLADALQLAGLRMRAESEGRLAFGVAAADDELAGASVAAERERLGAWLAENPEAASLARYAALARDEGGPPEGFRWVVRRDRERAHRPLPERDFVLLNEALGGDFDETDIESLRPTSDMLGYPALEFILKNERKAAFEQWTGSIVNRGLAVLLDDEVLVLAAVNEALPGQGVLMGGRHGFEPWERDALLAILSHGRLDAAPRLVEARLVEPPR